MWTETTLKHFCDEFAEHDRENHFTDEGKKALFAYLENYEFQSGERLRLDVVQLCYEYTEYPTAKKAAAFHGLEAKSEEEAIKLLEDETAVIEFKDGVIIFDF